MRIYMGERIVIYDMHGARTETKVVVKQTAPHGKTKPLRHVVYHSPTGFEWGYSGSGPADLALSILVDYFRERTTRDTLLNVRIGDVPPRSWRLHQKFKEKFIATALEIGFVIQEDDIDRWVASLGEKAVSQ